MGSTCRVSTWKSRTGCCAWSSGVEPVKAQPKEVEDWFEKALELEYSDPRAALSAYERAANDDADNVAAWINWGRLLHEQGRTKEAERIYRRGLERSVTIRC